MSNFGLKGDTLYRLMIVGGYTYSSPLIVRRPARTVTKSPGYTGREFVLSATRLCDRDNHILKFAYFQCKPG